jgi:hypothetical protein
MMRKTFGAILIGALAAGCGSSKPPATTGQSAQSPAAAAYSYARCMRAHGVPSFPDPHVAVSSPGSAAVAFRVTPRETGSPRFASAQKACNGILGPLGSGPSPAEQRARAASLLAFARCMRRHGIRDFPDPDREGQLRLPTVIAAGVDVHSRQFLDAGKACAGVTHGIVTAAEIEAGVNGTAGH